MRGKKFEKDVRTRDKINDAPTNYLWKEIWENFLTIVINNSYRVGQKAV